MAEKLTPQQRQAVENRGGNLLVSAAAGSGKTKVLVDRLLGYLTDEKDPANLDEFLIITYTKAAASELRGKIAAKLTEAIAQNPENRHLQRQMQRLFLTKISTVHGFCGDVLRAYAYRLDLSADFRVADENECRELREAVLADLLEESYDQAESDEAFRAFVDTQGIGRDDRMAAEIILKVYDSARCHLNPEGWLEGCLKDSDTDGLCDAGQTRWGAYLMEAFFRFLDSRIAVIKRCAELAEAEGNLAKPAQNLRTMLYGMQQLRASKTWDEIVANRNIDYGRLNFPRKNVNEELVEQIKACRNGCKKSLEKQLRVFADESSVILKDLADSGVSARGLIGMVRKFSERYDAAKRSRRVLDFGDLEHKMLDLVCGKNRSMPTAAAREIGAGFREIMVDEYQDSNEVQDCIFRALTGERGNCFMVGDVKQSIYQFRLADPGIFLEKYKNYAAAEDAQPGQGRKVLLSANFRSGGEVISAVNDVFTDCMTEAVGGLRYGEDEMLREGIPHEPMPDPAVEFWGIDVQDETYAEEPAFVARRIQELLDGNHQIRSGNGFRPIRPDDIVILLRSPGSVGSRFQNALERLGIGCSSGGGVDLLKTQEVEVLRSLLQTIANPRQDIPLLGTLASPVFGFSADDLAYFRGKQRQGCIYDALRAAGTQKTTAFLQTLETLRQSARMKTLGGLIEDIFRLTRMDSIFGAMIGGEVKKGNLQTFYTIACDYEAASRRSLGQFLEYLDLMEAKGLKTEGESATGKVTLMSIHKSKGLEFPVVFLAGLRREFNRESLRAQVLCDKDLGLGLTVADTENRVRYPALSKRAIAAKIASESLSEELRVLYVAMTRARDRLIMSYASRDLAGDIQNLALRYDICGSEMLAREVVCPGEWVLLSALKRMEAGSLHALGGKPSRTRLSDYPWKISVAEQTGEDGKAEEREAVEAAVPEEIIRQMQISLDFTYGHKAATQAPSKQTATQRKGRSKDAEASEAAAEPRKIFRNWRRPSFAASAPGGTDYGSAVHRAMQYIRYENCGSEAEIRKEIRRMVQERFMTPEQGEMVDPAILASFFATPLGQRLKNGAKCIREFKFSILDDGSLYGDGLEGEQVLLQGVVDCAILEEDGITVIDFKTDFVTEELLQIAVQRYSSQIRTYAEALEKIYEMPVKASYLYFFRLNRFVKV